MGVLARIRNRNAMNLLIFGATGPTGLRLVEQALEAGHQVTAFVRDPSRLTVSHSALRTISGDITDAAAVGKAIPGHDAVLSALGTVPKKPDTSLSDGTRHIVEAMKVAGIRRLLAVTSMGVGDSNAQMPFIFRVLTWTVIKHAWTDKERQEQIIRDSGLDWTIIRPGRLDTGEKTGTWKVLPPDAPAPKPNAIHRADVAAFMLDDLSTGAHVGKAVTLVGDYPPA